MNSLKIFKNKNFGQVRTIEEDGKILFCGSDVAKSLGYAIPSKAVNTHCKGVSKMEVPTNGGNQEMLFITEGDLYRLITNSKLPTAEKFESWVFDEVLPSIRKTGQYQVPKSPLELLQLTQEAILQVNSKVDSVEKDLQDFKMDMPILGIECEKITTAVRRKGTECLGGKKSKAYQDKSLRGKVYSDIYGQLKREFAVNTYRAIKRNQSDLAVEVIGSYKIPFALSEEIENTNKQICI